MNLSLHVTSVQASELETCEIKIFVYTKQNKSCNYEMNSL